MSGFLSSIKVHSLARSDTQNWQTLANIIRLGSRRGELAGTDLSLNGLLLENSALVLQIPPANLLIIRDGDENVRMPSPDNGLDCSFVNSCANFETLFRLHHSLGFTNTVCVGGRFGIEFTKVKDAKLVLHSSGCDEVGGGWWECDGSNGVVMLEGAEGFAAVSIPYSPGDLLALQTGVRLRNVRSEVGRGAGCCVGIGGESSLVDCALVSKKGTDPENVSNLESHCVQEPTNHQLHHLAA